MATSKNNSLASTNPVLGTISSLVIPGLGQFILNKRWRGILILLTTAVLAFLVYWSSGQKVANITVGTTVLSWLWLPLILFWVCNVLDSRQLAADKTSALLPGIILAAIILYVIAWNVTDVKLDRLVKNAGEARSVA